jgi:hypothetical protein
MNLVKKGNIMKKIIPVVIIGILIISGFGAVAINVDDEIPITIRKENEKPSSRDYTHTVFIEVGTATWCPSCPASNSAWHNIYEEGGYDFEYTELVIDKNSVAGSRMDDYNLYWVPTSYFDGGYDVEPGTNPNLFKSNLDTCGSRTVPDLDAEITALWLGDARIQIDLSIANNDNNDYPGTLRVYVIELVSRWNDYNGNPYYHGFLDFPWNQAIDIDSGDTFEDSKIWDGAAAGYGNIEPDNLQVILAVFDDAPHPAESDPYHDGDPPYGPFNAYYVDETVATDVIENQPPDAPTISGPTTGDPNVEYQFTFKSTDNEGEDIYYWIEWGDNSNSDWIGPYSSGVDTIVSHTYSSSDFFEITAKAKDTIGLESDWSSPHIIAIGDFAPDKPTISGPTQGKTKTEIEFTFVSTDTNEDDLYYTIKWGDGSTEDWFGPYSSGEEVKVSHSWKKEGTWVIEAKAKDTTDLESEWARFDVSIPRNKQSFDLLFKQIIERFPLLVKLMENLYNH